MKDYKEYLKSKAKPIRGSATLEPPTAGQDALQSIASMAVMDLISEGPIYGLIDKEGNVVKRYAPTTIPLNIEKDIEKLIV